MPAIATPSTSFDCNSERGDEPPRDRPQCRETYGRKRRVGQMEEQRQETSESSPAARRRRIDLSQTRRPDFRPPSPSESRSRKRSPSLTRQQTQSLRDMGTPRVIIETENITTDDNTEARDLWRRLREAANHAVVPKELQVVSAWTRMRQLRANC